MSMTVTQQAIEKVLLRLPYFVQKAVNHRYRKWSTDKNDGEACMIDLVLLTGYKPNPMDFPEQRRARFLMTTPETLRKELEDNGFTERMLDAFYLYACEWSGNVVGDMFDRQIRIFATFARLPIGALLDPSVRELVTAETKTHTLFDSW